MAEKPTGSSRGLIIGLVAVIVVIVLVVGLKSAFREKVEVRTAQASHADLVSTVSTNGKVEPIEDYQAHASAPGVVQNVFVEVGQRVQRGAQLIKLDDSDARSRVASAQASLDAAVRDLQNLQSGGSKDEINSENNDLTAARTQQQQATSDVSRLEALQAKGSASANEVASAKQRLTDAQTRISQLQTRRQSRYSSTDVTAQQAAVTQARAALSAAQSAYSGVDIRAPFSGTIYSVPVNNLDYVPGGEALLNMADLNRIQIRAYFDEPEIGKLAAGQPVKIVWDAKPYSTWHGHIALAPTTVSSYGTRSVGECLITVDDAKGDLLPNTTVTVTVTVAQLSNVLSLPREALRTEGLRDYVYKVVSGHLLKTPVQVGVVNNTRVQILSGLADGDIIALNSPSNAEFKNGLQVKALP
jgi:HlyD family secretion protein